MWPEVLLNIKNISSMAQTDQFAKKLTINSKLTPRKQINTKCRQIITVRGTPWPGQPTEALK